MNHKKVHRIYNELSLQLRNKLPKLHENRCGAVAANEAWAMDPRHWAQTNGAQWLDPPPARHWPQAAGVDHRHLVAVRAGDVVATLDRGCAEVGFPKTIRVDPGREFD